MKRSQFTPVLLAIAAVLGACSSLPKTTSLLDQTRSDYSMVQGNPKVETYAPLELKQASEALEQANAAARRNDSTEQIDKLAYLAKQKIALTQEVVKQKTAEADIVGAAKERDQIRLDQRTNEANQAKANAEESKLVAQIAEGDAAEAQRRMQIAQARTATLEAQLSDLAAKKTERGIVITLGDVLFGTDLSRLNVDGMATAQKLANVLQQNPQRTVLVEGFTDSTGSAEHNQELSDRRASAVRNVLQEMGVAGDRISVRGYGESHPIAANDTSANRQLNRRVEIVLSNENSPISQR